MWKNRPTLDQIISGTKCDRDKPFFLQKLDRVGHKKGPNGIGKCLKWGSIYRWSSPPSSSMGVRPFPPGQVLATSGKQVSLQSVI